MGMKLVAGLLAASLVGACAAGNAAPESASRAPAETYSRNPYPSTYQPYPGVPTLVTNVTIFDGEGGRIDNGSVLFADGEIVELGQNVAAPDGATVIDGAGKWVTPGIIDVHSHLGNYPSPSVEAHSDGNEVTGPVHPDVWAEHGVWPQDPGFSRALANGGVTSLQILPGSADLFGGRSVTLKNVPARTMQGMKFPGAPYGLKMAGGENPSRVYGSRNQSPATGMGNVAGYRSAFIEAQNYLRRWNEWREDGEGTPPTRDLRLETLAGVLEGDILVQNHCYRADEMAVMIDVAKEFGYRITAFHHAIEAYKVAPLLAREGICADRWTGWWGFMMEALDAVEANAALVDAPAGSCAVIHSDDAELTQRLNQEAAAALAAGRRIGMTIPEERAIGWITLNPARSLGIADQTGSLEAGKRADVVIWSANPFSVYARADQVFIDGGLAFDRFNPAYQPVSDFELGQPGYGVSAANVTQGAR